jgi:hypothetical protein
MAATFWPFAFVLSLVYTILLFYLSNYLRKKSSSLATIPNPGVATASNLLAMVGVFSFGVTTLFLPVNLLGCGVSDSVSTSSGSSVYNNAVVPTQLREWAASELYAAGTL